MLVGVDSTLADQEALYVIWAKARGGGVHSIDRWKQDTSWKKFGEVKLGGFTWQINKTQLFALHMNH